MGNLTTPTSVQKLQTALHAKAKAEAGYRFYALYDKISRDDILAHAYAQCRSNKGAPGVDGATHRWRSLRLRDLNKGTDRTVAGFVSLLAFPARPVTSSPGTSL